MKQWGIIFAALLVAACAGKDGAAGPTGPQGPQGPGGAQGAQGAQGPQGLPGPAGANGTNGANGVANKIVLTGIAGSSGIVTLALPAAVGSVASQPPAMACYMALTPSTGPWLAVSDGFWTVNTAWCSLGFANGVWNASMYNVPVGWAAAFVVVY
jgi:hypothetical protein